MTLRVGSAYAQFNLDIAPMRASVSEAKRLYAELEAVAARAARPQSAPSMPAGPRGPVVPSNAPDLDRDAAAARRAADEDIRLAQAKARLAMAAHDQKSALALLNGALGDNAGASEKVRLGLQTQIAQMQQGTTYAQQFGASLSSGLTGMLGPAAAATAAFAVLKGTVDSFVDAFKFKAQLDANNAGITAQLKGVRDSAQAFAEARKFGNEYKLTQQEITAAMQTSVGVMRKSQSSVEDIFSTLARLRMMSPEQSMENAALALKELQNGDITSIVTRFEIARTEANKMKAEIKGGADAVQVLSKYLNESGMTMEALKAQTMGAAGALKDMAIANEELKLAQAEWAQGPGMAILNTRIEATRGLTRLLSGDWAAMGQSIVNSTSTGAVAIQNLERDLSMIRQTAAQNGGEAAAALQELNGQIMQAASVSPEAADGVLNMAAALANGEMTVETFRGALAGLIAHQQAQAQASATASQTISYQSQAMIEASAAAQANAAALLEQTQKTIEAKTQSEQLAAFQATLARLGSAVAGGHLTAAQAAGQLGAQYAWATGKAYELIQAQAQLAGVSSGGASIADGQAQYTARLQAQGEYYTKIRDAQEQQTIQIGSAAEKQATLNRQLERARVTYGEQSVEFIKAETALKAHQQSQAKAAGGGGAGKISAAQKLNGQLSDIQTAAYNKAEDEDLKHHKNLFKIYQDFAKKRLEAEEQYRQMGLDSRADFYEQLGSIESHELQRELSARYEALKLEADKIAAEQGADAAQRYFEAGQQALQKQAQLREQIRKAEEGDEDGEGKDANKAEYLRGVLAEREKADQARLESIKAHGSEIANEHQQQLNDELLRYEESQGKIAESAERAAQKKVTQAQRSTKATADENVELQKQLALYQQLGKAPATPAGDPFAPTPAATAVTPPTAATPGNTSAAAQIMAVIDQALLDAVNAQTTTLASKMDEMTGAVRSLAPRLEAIERAVKAAKNGVG